MSITVPPTAPPQFGFAFGAPGTAVTNAVLSGTQGTLSTQQLPPGTSGAWITETALQPGSATVSLTTTKPVTGSFSVAPASATTPTYFDSFSCALAGGAPMPSSSFTVDKHPTYARRLRAWHLAVTIPTAGVVHAAQLEPSTGLGAVMKKTAMPLVESHAVPLESAGTATLTLRPTARGQRSLATGALHVRLQIVFDPEGGKSSSRLVTLTLAR